MTAPSRKLAHGLATLLVFAAALAFYAGFVDYGFNREDEGTLLTQFWRWSTGEVPYRDFHMGYTPGVHFLHKTLMQWFGPSLMPGRWLLCLVNASAATMLFALTARVTGSWKWGLLSPFLYMAAVPVFPGHFASFNIPYPVWYNVFLFAITASLAPRISTRPTLALLLASGLLAGVGFTFKPNVGLFQLAAPAMLCLLGFGRPRTRGEAVLWWTWWLSLLGGLLVVFSSAPSSNEILKFLSPAAVAAVALARDAYRRGPRHDVPPLLACAVALGGGFALVCVPWLAWSYSILGPEWFARRALFLGTGFESFYYLSGPPLQLGWSALLAGMAAWSLPAWIHRRGWPAWPLPVAGSVAGVAGLAWLVLSRPMPDGFYSAVTSAVEPKVYTAAAFVQWAALIAWIARRKLPLGPAPTGDLLAPAVVCGVLLYLQIFPRTDFMHWVTAAPLLFPVTAWLLQMLTLRWSAGGGAVARRAAGLAIVLPVVGLGMLRLGNFLDARWDVVDGGIRRTPETRLAVPHAPLSINVGQAELFRDLEATVEFLQAGSAPDETVFTFPALDFVSYMALRKPGNRHGYYFPGWPGHETEAEVLTALHRDPPTLVVTLYQHQFFFADASAYYFLFADFVESRYRRVARLGPYAVFAPAGSAAAEREETVRNPATLAGGERTAIADALGPDRMNEIDRALASGDADTRLAAVREMSGWSLVGDFEPVRRALEDEDIRVRGAAARAVPASRSVPTRDALIRGVAAGAFASPDAVRALRSASTGCDASCVPALLPLVRSFDYAVADAARGLLTNLPASRWRSDFWWRWEGDPAPDFDEDTRKLLTGAMGNLEADPLLRMLAYGFADKLGMGPCPKRLRQWSAMPLRFVGNDSTVYQALHQVVRGACPGDWLDDALRWFPIEGILLPRIALAAARLRPDVADAELSRHAAAGFGRASALANWLCGMVGGEACLAAARTTLTGMRPEDERVAAAWSWSQLARDDEDIEELRSVAALDPSPQVRETLEYGVQLRDLRLAQR